MRPVIVLATIGTHGDLWPVLALGKALMCRGARVRISAPESFLPHAAILGMETSPCRPNVDALTASRFADSWDHVGRAASGKVGLARPSAMDLAGRYEDLMSAARGADLFISASTQFLGNLVPEMTGIPSMILAICPIHVTSSPILSGGQPPLSSENCQTISSQPDGEPLVNILNHIREFRVRIGLPEHQPDSSGLLSIARGSRIVASISSRFCEPDMEQFPNLNFTGFWFHDRPEWRDWRPGRQLERFVEQGNPPLVLTFSSLPLCNAESVLRIHARTAKLLSRKLVVISGWAGFDQRHIPAECREEVMVTDELPHSWLFERSAAVIHHGGIGTLAQAMRCGTPMLVEPYGNDQFFNASRVVKLGIGAAANPHWMTPEALALLIDTKVIAKETQQRVRALSDAIADDPGVELAADLVMAAV